MRPGHFARACAEVTLGTLPMLQCQAEWRLDAGARARATRLAHSPRGLRRPLHQRGGAAHALEVARARAALVLSRSLRGKLRGGSLGRRGGEVYRPYRLIDLVICVLRMSALTGQLCVRVRVPAKAWVSLLLSLASRPARDADLGAARHELVNSLHITQRCCFLPLKPCSLLRTRAGADS